MASTIATSLLIRPTLANLKLEHTLTQDQADAIDAFVEWYRSGDPVFILAGFAGTGKTTVLKYLCQLVSTAALTAPTNQAVKVLASLHTGCTTATIYSLLGLRMEEEEDRLVLRKAERSQDTKYEVVFVDEASMLNEEMVTKHIGYSIAKRVRYVFIGDPKQLNPIGEKRSAIWNLEARKAVLTTIVRHDNQILQLSTYVRKTKIRDLILRSNNDGQEGVWYLPNNKFESKLIEHVEAGFFTDDRARALAWRNKTVNSLNKVIRKTLFGKDSEQHFLPQERLLFASPFEFEERKIYIDDTLNVESVSTSKHPDHDFWCTYLKGKHEGAPVTIRTVTPDQESDYMELLTNFADKARKGDTKMWRHFWGLKHSVAVMKYRYGTTVHRAQGSTYHTAFVDAEDICTNSSKLEARRCLYVGVSRPTTQLYMR